MGGSGIEGDVEGRRDAGAGRGGREGDDGGKRTRRVTETLCARTS